MGVIWGESCFNLKILLLLKLHTKRQDAHLLFSINKAILCCSGISFITASYIESLRWIKPCERRGGDAVSLMDYSSVTEVIRFLCWLSTNVENKPYSRGREFCFLPNSIGINSLLGESPKNIALDNKLLNYWQLGREFKHCSELEYRSRKEVGSTWACIKRPHVPPSWSIWSPKLWAFVMQTNLQLRFLESLWQNCWPRG